MACPVAMTMLFLFVSIPLMERHMAGRPGYAAYAARVPALLPGMRSRRSAPEEA